MSKAAALGTALKYPCEKCPIRQLKAFRPFTPEELDFVRTFKSGELTVDPRATILQEGTSSTHLFTVLQGWAFRYKTLPDGRRQLLNFALPGDFLGLQASLFKEMSHSVEALHEQLHRSRYAGPPREHEGTSVHSSVHLEDFCPCVQREFPAHAFYRPVGRLDHP